MGWVDLDLNLPPPAPDDLDGFQPSPSQSLEEHRHDFAECRPEEGEGTAAAATSAEFRSVEGEGEREGGGATIEGEGKVETLRVLVVAEEAERSSGAEERGEDGCGGSSVGVVIPADKEAPPSPSPVFSHLADFSEQVESERLISSCDEPVCTSKADAFASQDCRRESDEEETIGSRIRGRSSGRVDAASIGGDLSEADGTSAVDDVFDQPEENAAKPPRKRLRTLGQLRNQKLDKNVLVSSGDKEKAGSSSSPAAAGIQPLHKSDSSNVQDEGGAEGAADDAKDELIPDVKLERTSSVLPAVNVPLKPPVSESSSHQDEKEKVLSEGEETASGEKKKNIGLKDVMPDKRRRSIVVLESEAQAPLKRPRLPRSQPIRRSRSFGGVIVGEKLDEGNPMTKLSKLESPQGSETGKSSIRFESPRERRLTTESPGKVVKEWKPEVVKGDIGVVDSNKDVEMPQQVDQEVELGEVSGVSDEKQYEKPGNDITVPRRPRKMKQIAVPAPRAVRSAKPPPAVKPTEFIRPTVKKPPGIATLRRQPSNGGQTSRSELRSPFQDTTIERLQREATCSKLWQSPGDSELQKVPGSFASVEDYAKVFEPLLFEECRAQLHNSWEELLEGTAGEPHAAVMIKNIERRERGWYDLVLMPMDPKRELRFKEGDVGVLSTPKPGPGTKRRGRLKDGKLESAEEGQIAGRVAGIVRRFVPVDVRDPPGAIFRFHVSQEDMNRQSNGEAESITNSYHTLQQLQQGGGLWYLTGIGSFTTTQREYSALHLLPNFRPQMMNAILQPRPELFPGYADMAPPAMPDCFTSPFIQHLHSGFNTPQLAAIQWAAAHTAAGTPEVNSTTSSGGQPWPFTLVQGPPGTGKTHTVWGMLNVIHLVQYQRYYAALLKKLAPGSLSTSDESSLSNGGDNDGDGWGTIDEVLQKMDRSLARVLPKLCPKPRMLVCAPSNAATDELLSRVLDRGFIDGEMKVYRPDVARVGVDTSSRAAQAVSVERRTEQLLAMDQTQVVRWLQSLRSKEFTLGQTVTGLQKDLIDAAATSRSQGNVGVDPEILASRDQMRDGKLQQLAAVVEERDKVLVEMSRLFIVEGKFRPGNNFRPEDARRKLEASFANEAEIVFTTVSSSGRKIFSQLAHGFDMVVIDEAAQASEVAVLPPLSLRAARCVLVGDPQQLPATVISRAADTMKYSRSLFERFQQAGCPAILLSVQYRMHPQIRDFPSRYFYQGRLVDSESVKALPEDVYHKDSLLQPYLFFDISFGRESHAGSVSYQNKMEAQVAVHLYQHLQKVVAGTSESPPTSVSVGIITPYKQQLQCLEKEFVGVVGSNAASKGVYINTVDAFQGQERDVIMMSCVRASSHGVGFVADIRRMNVALTRARRSLWVIGNASALIQSEDWAALLGDAKERGCFVDSSTCIQRGLLPEPPMGSLGTPLGSPGLLLHPRPVGLLSRGRGLGPHHGGRHFPPGRHHYSNLAGEGSHWQGRQNGNEHIGAQERGPDGTEFWQRQGYDRSCRGQRDGPRPPGFGPTFQHPSRRNKGL